MSVWAGMTPPGGSACAEFPTATAPTATAATPPAINALLMLRTLVLLSKETAAPQRECAGAGTSLSGPLRCRLTKPHRRIVLAPNVHADRYSYVIYYSDRQSLKKGRS